MRNPQTPLSPLEQEAFDRLEQQFDSGDNFERETALIQLKYAEFEREEATELIEQLLLKGYLYEVDEGLRIT
ncbi:MULTISPECIES: hypothetical protein [unclassified Haloferax]|jgi:hypothetical protein|uniref:hypothetical protein n=1 Tax=unclassified Haloferax TaxID=2625095 RepID=UPI0028768C97|nr:MULTISPECIES: hypothetical protein [unclassified Haloferax]MDS0243165.1 hypothetical protein [Haloferax sp. S2CR25]MDS0446286.1 hypothetical protein [Haloferax sp. S2CR25-2]